MAWKTWDGMKDHMFTYDELRPCVASALQDRARYLGFMYRTLPKDVFEKVARKALFQHGYTKGPNIPGERGVPSTLGDKLVYSTVIANSCDYNEYIVNDGEKCVVQFQGPCNLCEGWAKMGFSPEEVKYLCDVACSGDHGMAAALGLKVHFTRRFSDGNGANCEIVIEKADEE